MSAYGDEFSDGSFEGSETASVQKDEPPTLDETIFDDSLFGLFLNYMKSQQQDANLMFLKDARNFRLFNQPRDVIVHHANRIIMTYFTTAGPHPISVSDDMKKKMINIAFDPAAELSIDKDMFSVAFGEVYNAVVPQFRDWISSNEWRDAVPFHRLPPPTFNVVLTSAALRVLFNKYLKAQLDRDTDGTAGHAFHVWKFCLIANDFRDGKYTHDSHLDEKKKKKKGDSEEDAKPEPPKEEEGEGEKKVNPEEYAKRLYKKYKHHISLPYDKTMPHAVFIIRALDSAIEEFDKSALFSRWLSLKQYQGVDFQAKTVHQSLTPDGFAEPPTLAAMLTSSILSTMLSMLQSSEPGMNLEFLTDILVFRNKFIKFGSEGSSGTSQDSSDGNGKSKKDMLDEAKRIFNKFLDKGEMYCDPALVEEVRQLITKNGGKNITPTMFRKCGAFIYIRSEQTWCREARATFEWVSRSYDNRSKNARGVEEEFSAKVLPENTDLQIVPSLDDILDNESLVFDYSDFLNKEGDQVFVRFFTPFTEYFKTPIHQRKPILDKIMIAFADIAKKLPEISAPSTMISKEVAGRERVTDTVVNSLLGYVVRAAARHYYKRWLVEHANTWKTAKWSPSASVRFGDLDTIATVNAVESKIEESALKGKSGFSRYLAKRQLKKQATGNIHVASQSKKGASIVLSTGTYEMKKGENAAAQASAASVSLVIPSIHDTLSSPYLRELFAHTLLETRLTATDLTLWEALSAFFKKYQAKENDDIFDAQDEMRKDALELVDKYKALIPNSSALKDKIGKQKILLPYFFRPVEKEVYSKLHSEYEEILRKKGWH